MPERRREQDTTEPSGSAGASSEHEEAGLGNAATAALLSASPPNLAAAAPSARSMLARGVVQRRADDGSDGAGVLDDATAGDIRGRLGTGRTLDPDVAAQAGRDIGDDYSSVRIHTDAKADSLARDLEARAFTAGSDIFFRAGRYDPGGGTGRRLLFHELTHVTQQRGMTGSGAMSVVHPDHTTEREASAVADKAASAPRAPSTARDAPPAAGQHAGGAVVQRAPEKAGTAKTKTNAPSFASYADLVSGISALAVTAIKESGRRLGTTRFGPDLTRPHRALLEQMRKVLLDARDTELRRNAVRTWPRLAVKLRAALDETRRMGGPADTLAAVAEQITLVGTEYLRIRGKEAAEAPTVASYVDAAADIVELLWVFTRLREAGSGFQREEVAGRPDAQVSGSIRELNDKYRKQLLAVKLGDDLVPQHKQLLETLRRTLVTARTEAPGSAVRARRMWASIAGDLKHVVNMAKRAHEANAQGAEQLFLETESTIAEHYARVHQETIGVALTKQRRPEEVKAQKAVEKASPSLAAGMREHRAIEDMRVALAVVERQMSPSPQVPGEWILKSGPIVARLRSDQALGLRAGAADQLKKYMASLTTAMVQAWMTMDELKRGTAQWKLDYLAFLGGAEDPGDQSDAKNLVIRARDQIYVLVDKGRLVDAFEQILQKKSFVEVRAKAVADYDADTDRGYNRLATACKIVQVALIAAVPVLGEAALAGGAGFLAVGATSVGAGAVGAAGGETLRQAAFEDEMDWGKVYSAGKQGGVIGAGAVGPASTRAVAKFISPATKGTSVAATSLAGGTVGGVQSLAGGGSFTEGFVGGAIGGGGSSMAGNLLGSAYKNPVVKTAVETGIGAVSGEVATGDAVGGAVGGGVGAIGGSIVAARTQPARAGSTGDTGAPTQASTPRLTAPDVGAPATIPSVGPPPAAPPPAPGRPTTLGTGIDPRVPAPTPGRPTTLGTGIDPRAPAPVPGRPTTLGTGIDPRGPAAPRDRPTQVVPSGDDVGAARTEVQPAGSRPTERVEPGRAATERAPAQPGEDVGGTRTEVQPAGSRPTAPADPATAPTARAPVVPAAPAQGGVTAPRPPQADVGAPPPVPARTAPMASEADVGRPPAMPDDPNAGLRVPNPGVEPVPGRVTVLDEGQASRELWNRSLPGSRPHVRMISNRDSADVMREWQAYRPRGYQGQEPPPAWFDADGVLVVVAGRVLVALRVGDLPTIPGAGAPAAPGVPPPAGPGPAAPAPAPGGPTTAADTGGPRTGGDTGGPRTGGGTGGPSARPAPGVADRGYTDPGSMRPIRFDHAINDADSADAFFRWARADGRRAIAVDGTKERARLEELWIGSYGRTGKPPMAWIDTAGNVVVDSSRVSSVLQPGTIGRRPARPPRPKDAPEEEPWIPADEPGLRTHPPSNEVDRVITDPAEAARLYAAERRANYHVSFTKDRPTLIGKWKTQFGQQGDNPPPAWIDKGGGLHVDLLRVSVGARSPTIPGVGIPPRPPVPPGPGGGGPGPAGPAGGTIPGVGIPPRSPAPGQTLPGVGIPGRQPGPAPAGAPDRTLPLGEADLIPAGRDEHFRPDAPGAPMRHQPDVEVLAERDWRDIGTVGQGNNENRLLRNTNGEVWLFKPAGGETDMAYGPDLGIRRGERWRRAIAAAFMTKRVRVDTPDVRLVRLGHREGSLQRWRDDARTAYTYASSRSQAEQDIFQRFMQSDAARQLDTLDFFLANQDRHTNNFMFRMSGNEPQLVAIDQDAVAPPTAERFSRRADQQARQDYQRPLPPSVSREFANQLRILKLSFPEATLRRWLTQAEVDGIKARLEHVVDMLNSRQLRITEDVTRGVYQDLDR